MNTKNDLALIKSEIGTYEEKENWKHSVLAALGTFCFLAMIIFWAVMEQ